ncbi:MAG: peptide-methionine (R)-S-oxide reductase [Alteromonadaceae bacterium]|nr:MAG: peptide-methionine (R)-S-oxide reductase [Alteromonadaceae bacterium]
MSDNELKDDAFWRGKLSESEYQICREKGTERPFTGEYWDSKERGVYLCRCCGARLFQSEAKYDSGSGWPSFYASVDEQTVENVEDYSGGMSRTEIVCSHCDSHLGHVFPDGPQPTGLRYCVNSASILLSSSGENTEKEKPS